MLTPLLAHLALKRLGAGAGPAGHAHVPMR
jgi:hypothetical protein